MLNFLNTLDKAQRIPVLILVFKLVVSMILISLSFYLTVRGFRNESEIMISSNINTGILAYWLASNHNNSMKTPDTDNSVNTQIAEVTVNESDTIGKNKPNP